jgi:hypothetical protein
MSLTKKNKFRKSKIHIKNNKTKIKSETLLHRKIQIIRVYQKIQNNFLWIIISPVKKNYFLKRTNFKKTIKIKI